MFRNRRKATYSALGKKQVLRGRGGGGRGVVGWVAVSGERVKIVERGVSMQDEDTTMWKEGEISFMEAKKGKKNLVSKGI